VSSTELIEELTDICRRQAEIIEAQGLLLEQFGAWDREEEALAQRNRLEAITGNRS
jgi:hypothetical protein